jgi:predicted TIM-barrel fold metal-dependent hydrolase
MDAVGVDGALLVSPWTMYRYDASYVLEVYAQFPRRFGLIKPFDPGSAQLDETFAAWVATPGAVGARIVLMDANTPDPDAHGLKRILAAGAMNGLPINMLCWGRLALFRSLAEKHPNTQFVLDHLGLTQPFKPPVPRAPFADLDDVLALAQCDNVAIKITGACTLSHAGFPYRDLWPPLTKIFRAFGFERCMWGTDWTRATAFLTYAEGVEAFRVMEQLSGNERALLMGGTLASIYNWAPGRD